MNFVKNDILKMWKMRFSKCDFLDKLRIFAPVWGDKRIMKYCGFLLTVYITTCRTDAFMNSKAEHYKTAVFVRNIIMASSLALLMLLGAILLFLYYVCQPPKPDGNSANDNNTTQPEDQHDTR